MNEQSLFTPLQESGGATELQRRDADVDLLLGLTEDFLRLSSEGELMQVIGANLGAHLKLDSFNFLDVDEARGEATNSVNWNARDVPDLRGTYRLADYVTDDFIPSMRAGAVYVINDTQSDPRTIAASAAPLQVRACIILPYNRDGVWKGCFVVTDRRQREWGKGEVDLVQQVASRTFPQIERLRAEKQLLLTNQRLQQVLSSIPDDFYVLDRDWVFRFVSRSFTARIGKEPEEYLGRNIWEMFPKHVGGELYQNFHIAMERRETRRFETPGRYTDAWYSITAFPSSEGIAVYGIDITKLRQAEKALQESEARYRDIVETANEGIWEIDKDTRTTFVNPPMAGMLGYPAAEILGRTPFEFMFPKDQITGQRRLDRAKTGVAAKASEFRWRRRDGSALWTLNTTSPRFDERGTFLGSTAMMMDITERRRVEQALYERDQELQILNASLEQKVEEKTVEVRQLAADITRAVQRERNRLSHVLHDDLQQRIYAIQMQLGILRDGLPAEDEKARWEAADIERELGHVLEITRNLSLDLSPPILREEGLAQAIRWLADRMLLRYGLPITVEAGGPFYIPDQELHVFLVNCVRELLFNTVKHAQASRATVGLRRVHNRLQIGVRDDGQGFPLDESQGENGEDEGAETLGIPAMRRQLTVFGGTMDIQSAPGGGTKTILTIPLPR